MYATNLRGYLFLSKSKNVIVDKLEGCFNENKFYFDSHFEAIQNITFECEEEADIYLVINNNEKMFIGTTSYQLFLNTSIPFSYPFFNSLKPNSYLFSPSNKEIRVSYDAIAIKKEVLEDFKDKTITSYSLYLISKNDLYAYENLEKIHKPLEVVIKY
jgi:hypothetical protein